MKVVTNNTLSYFWSKLKALLGAKQDTLVSGTNIKTLNGQSLVGSGNVAIQIPPAPPEPLLVYMTESGGTYSIDQEVLDIEDALSDNDELECYLVWDGNNPAVVRLRCYGYNVKETIGSNSQSCIVWSGLDNIGNRHIVKAYHDSTNDVDVVNYSVASPDGKGITNIAKTATVGLVDTYTITYSDGTTSTYTVTNGRDGQDGQDGADGVSLGEIALVQTTGDDEESVMSQKAVTDYGRKLLKEEDVNGNGTMMRQILTSLGWEFDKYIREGGGYTAATDNVVTPFIEIGECGNHIIEAAYFLTGSSTNHVVFFNSNKTRATSFPQYETNRYFRTLGDVSTKYVRYTVHVDRIRDCYIYDHTAKQFLFKGDEYLDDIINNYNVGYGYMGDKNVLKHTFIKPTCFLGTLCYYKLSKFPNLDPRTCDGLSVALDGYMGGSWGLTPFLLMHTGSNNFNTANYFAIAATYSTIRCGELTGYYQTVVNGCSLAGTNTKFAHLVITFDFKTGTVTSYNNGVLSATNTPETYSESDLRTFLNSCTELYLGWGLKTACMAVFPYVLTAADVKSIYGVGVSSTKGELIPDIWNANLLHPQTYSGQNIGIYLINANVVRSNDGDAAVLTSNATTAQFGFTGIKGTIHNHIYEWDMEVVSGTWTQYSRGMIYNNNYYKYVTIYDSNNNVVSYDELSTGNYHVICKPNNELRGNINASHNQLNYIFNTTEGAVMKITNLKVVEKGAALICGINNFKGDYFEQINGDKVPVAKFQPYNGGVLTDYYTTYKEDVIEYSSSATVQYTGQMAVDITNNKVYVGYLSGNGGSIWKQINNS